MLESIRMAWSEYSLTTISLILYWLAVVWMLLFEKRKRAFFGLCVFVPAFIVALETVSYLILGDKTLDKMFLLIPTGMALCYVGVLIAEQHIDAKKTWLMVALYVIIIQAGLNLRYDVSIFQKNQNLYKVSDTVIDIADALEKDEQLTSPYMIAPDEIASQIQEYDADIRVIYGLDFDYSSQSVESLMTNMENYQCNCLVIPTEDADDEILAEAGYRTVIICDGYTVYART